MGDSRQEERSAEFEELIQLVLDLDPSKYAAPWDDRALLMLRQLLSKGENAFPKKARVYIFVLKKFLFDNGQLLAMAAAAHAHAQRKNQEEESLIVKPSKSDFDKIQGAKK